MLLIFLWMAPRACLINHDSRRTAEVLSVNLMRCQSPTKAASETVARRWIFSVLSPSVAVFLRFLSLHRSSFETADFCRTAGSYLSKWQFYFFIATDVSVDRTAWVQWTELQKEKDRIGMLWTFRRVDWEICVVGGRREAVNGSNGLFKEHSSALCSILSIVERARKHSSEKNYWRAYWISENAREWMDEYNRLLPFLKAD